MKRLLLLVSLAGLVGGFHEWTVPAHAAATCDAISITQPARTAGSNGNYYLSSVAHIANCSAKTYLITTLLVENGGSYSETGCDGQPQPSCAEFWPTTGGNCDAGLHFCAYTNVTRYTHTDPNGNMCGRNFRSRLQVYNSTGTFLGQDVSSTFRC